MDRQKLKRDLIKSEGLKLRLYPDSLGIPTIGVGRNLQSKGISQETAFQMLNEDIEEAVGDLLTFPWFIRLNEPRQRAITNMRFNLGHEGFRNFKKMITALENEEFKEASTQMLTSKWAAQVKNRATRLAKVVETGQD